MTKGFLCFFAVARRFYPAARGGSCVSPVSGMLGIRILQIQCLRQFICHPVTDFSKFFRICRISHLDGDSHMRCQFRGFMENIADLSIFIYFVYTVFYGNARTFFSINRFSK